LFRLKRTDKKRIPTARGCLEQAPCGKGKGGGTRAGDPTGGQRANLGQNEAYALSFKKKIQKEKEGKMRVARRDKGGCLCVLRCGANEKGLVQMRGSTRRERAFGDSSRKEKGSGNTSRIQIEEERERKKSGEKVKD